MCGSETVWGTDHYLCPRCGSCPMDAGGDVIESSVGASMEMTVLLDGRAKEGAETSSQDC